MPATRRLALRLIGGTLVTASLWTGAMAQDAPKIPVVSTFSILSDVVANVGGERIAIDTLVGRDGDAHVYSPTPAAARRLGEAKVVFANGLNFEGWIKRLIKSSGTKAPLIEVAAGIRPLKGQDDHGHDGVDPHAWQDVSNVKRYVAAIRDGLSRVDPAGKATYEANATSYLAKLDALDAEIRTLVAAIPAQRRRIITSHDAFRYFEAAYGVTFIAPQGVSTDSEASARDVARIIKQIKAEKITAIFMENVSDPRLMQRIASETGATLGNPVFSDALSESDGPAGTYIDMMRHNIRAFSAALAG